jgi:hypothetical protein
LTVADADRLAAAWRLTLYGLRRGEVCGLRCKDIDVDARTVTIGRACLLVNARVIVKEPKSDRGYRVGGIVVLASVNLILPVLGTHQRPRPRPLTRPPMPCPDNHATPGATEPPATRPDSRATVTTPHKINLTTAPAPQSTTAEQAA